MRFEYLKLDEKRTTHILTELVLGSSLEGLIETLARRLSGRSTITTTRFAWAARGTVVLRRVRTRGLLPLRLFHAHFDFMMMKDLAEIAAALAEKPWLELAAGPEGDANVHVFSRIGAATEIDAADWEGVRGR